MSRSPAAVLYGILTIRDARSAARARLRSIGTVAACHRYAFFSFSRRIFDIIIFEIGVHILQTRRFSYKLV